TGGKQDRVTGGGATKDPGKPCAHEAGLERTASGAPPKAGRCARSAKLRAASTGPKIYAADERADALLGGDSVTRVRWGTAAPPADDLARNCTFVGWWRFVCGCEAVASGCVGRGAAVGAALGPVRPRFDPFDRRTHGRHRKHCGRPIRCSS